MYKTKSIRSGIQSEGMIEEDANRFDDTLFDFGIKYRIVSNGIKLAVHISVVGWESIRQSGIASLQNVFGIDRVISVVENNYNKHSFFFRVINGFDVALIFSTQSNVDESLMSHLSNIRSIVLGADLKRAFLFLGEKSTEIIDHDESFHIPLQRNIHTTENKKQLFNIVVSPQIDRITIIIPVPYIDKTERALARLFLQQFQQAHKESIGKNAPLCMYRRGSDPPRELVSSFKALETEYEEHTNILAGYCTLTFLSIHVDTEEKRQNAIQSILTFTDFIDDHVKKSKLTVNVSLRLHYSKFLERLKNV